MRSAKRLATATIIAVALASSASAQTADPPVLSTVPTPPPGASSNPAQMSGLPIQVGDLPPGMVTVRVIRGNFNENVTNQKVELQLVALGQSRAVLTGQDGRAVFGGLQLGQTVQARAVVDGEALDSQSFILPFEGGVRLVLVAGAGLTASAPTGQGNDSTPVTAMVPVFFGLVTVGVAALWLLPAGRRRKAERTRPAGPRSESPHADDGF
jgi:hypothetical protein